MLSSNISSTCPHNMVNFGPLAAEIVSLVWGTPANFNGFGSVTARHSSSGRQPNFAALNRGRHLYSAGRPSRWALAHILVLIFLSRIAASASPVEGAIPGLGSSPLLNYVCFDVCLCFYFFFFLLFVLCV